MPQFRHILFPIDFSERCHAIRPFVKAMAQSFEAHVTLMHVIQIPAGLYAIVLDIPETEKKAQIALEDFFECSDPPQVHPGQIVVDQGDPATQIIKYAHANDVDLIMMPTHGYGEVRALLLGSVTAKVLHDSKCPVWTACHIEQPRIFDGVKCQNMFCSIDTTPESVDTIRYATELASRFQAKLRLVHAVPGAGPPYADSERDPFNSFLLDSARDKITQLQQSAGTNWEICIGGGKVSKVVHDAALHHDGDLIVIGRGKRSELLGRLRTHAYSIIRDAPCPVLSL
jgi:nucleotide-binding universal stress UspA family protein